MRDSATLLRSPLAHSATCARKRGRFFSSILLIVLVAALPGLLKAQQTERTLAAPLSAEDQSLLAQASRVFVARDRGNDLLSDVKERAEQAPPIAAAAVLSSAFENGTNEDVSWALGVLRKRQDLQPVFLPKTVKLMLSTDSRAKRYTGDSYGYVPLAGDAILALSQFDPQLVQGHAEVQKILLELLKNVDIQGDTRWEAMKAHWAAIAWLNLYGESPQTLAVLEKGINRPLGKGRFLEPYLAYENLRRWPDSLAPRLREIATQEQDSDRRLDALELLSHHRPDLGHEICREVLNDSRQSSEVAQTAFGILFPADQDPSALFRLTIERHREKLFPPKSLPSESVDGVLFRHSMIIAMHRKFGFAGTLAFLRKEFEEANEDPQRIAVVRMLAEVSTSDVEQRKQAAALMGELAAGAGRDFGAEQV